MYDGIGSVYLFGGDAHQYRALLKYSVSTDTLEEVAYDGGSIFYDAGCILYYI